MMYRYSTSFNNFKIIIVISILIFWIKILYNICGAVFKFVAYIVAIFWL